MYLSKTDEALIEGAARKAAIAYATQAGYSYIIGQIPEALFEAQAAAAVAAVNAAHAAPAKKREKSK